MPSEDPTRLPDDLPDDRIPSGSIKRYPFPKEEAFSDRLAERLREHGYRTWREVTYCCHRSGKADTFRMDIVCSRPVAESGLPFDTFGIESKYNANTGDIVDGIIQVQRYWIDLNRTTQPGTKGKKGEEKEYGIPRPRFVLLTSPDSLFFNSLVSYGRFDESTALARYREMLIIERVLWKTGGVSILRQYESTDAWRGAKLGIGFESNFFNDAQRWYQVLPPMDAPIA